jgi:hypothetical protein
LPQHLLLLLQQLPLVLQHLSTQDVVHTRADTDHLLDWKAVHVVTQLRRERLTCVC